MLFRSKMSKRVPEFVNRENMTTLLNDVDFGDGFLGARNKMVVDLLYQTGMRRNELVTLKLSQVDMSGGFFRVIGKRDKERLIPMSRSEARRVGKGSISEWSPNNKNNK